MSRLLVFAPAIIFALTYMLYPLPAEEPAVTIRWLEHPPGERVASASAPAAEAPLQAVVVPPPPPEPEPPIPAPAEVPPRRVVVEAARAIEPVPLAMTVPVATPRPAPAVPVATAVPVAAPGDLASAVLLDMPGYDVATVLRVMKCESQFNPLAVGSAGERGLLQIHPVHAQYNPRTGTSLIGSLGYTWDQMFEVGPNLAVAAYLLRSSGWASWSCARV